MLKPPVFTAEEIDRFRREIAAQRAPGAYEPGRWSVSPLNRRPDVVGAMPESVRLRDATLRSMETLPGVVATDEQKLGYLKALVVAGVGEIVTAGLMRRTDDQLRQEIAAIKEANAECVAVCPLVGTEAAVDRAAAAGFDSVQVWIQGFGAAAQIYSRIYDQAWAGEDWRTDTTPRDRAEVVAAAAKLVRAARDRGLTVATPLLMVSYLTEDMLADSVAALVEADVSEITLFDGPGAMSPEGFGYLVEQTRKLAPGVRVGLHPHNTFGMAVGCAVAAARAGAEVIELSVNGYCGGPGNADLAATAMAFEAVYGVSTGIDTGKLTELARVAERLTGYHRAYNHPMTGDKAFAWGGMDIITQESAVDPLLHNCVDPELVGNQRVAPFTPDSGPYTLADKLLALGLTPTHEQVTNILAAARAVMAAESRVLDEQDLRHLAHRELS
ncbi:MAG TPA: hypothetical protein VG756_32260 [Pseudonocardiaceae bacterium]|nr:hypothetical protein [Pseudonocardiaceae bacterium]